MSAVWRSGGEYGRGHGEVDCGLLSHCGSPGHSVASHSGPPGRGMASLVAPSNGTDLITEIVRRMRAAQQQTEKASGK